jgi:class 3 adenylate cyclase
VTGDAERAAADALRAGDALVAYDAALRACDQDPTSLDARYLAALALARAGSSDGARRRCEELLGLLAAAPGARGELVEDAGALMARLAKDQALEIREPLERRGALRHAADLYHAVFERSGGSFPCINAATLYALAGDDARARALAAQARELAVGHDRTDGTDHVEGAAGDYWAVATCLESALILGELAAVPALAARAAKLGRADAAMRATTYRQLRLLVTDRDLDRALLDALRPPVVLHFCGHRADDDGHAGRWATVSTERVEREIAAFLDRHEFAAGYGSLASGADILVAEQLAMRGIDFHVVLPFALDEFVHESVAPAGPAWVNRFRRGVERAASLSVACDSAYAGNDELYGHAARIAMGRAINHARHFGSEALQLALYDGGTPGGAAGTAHDVGVWRATGRQTHVVSVGGPGDPEPATRRRDGTRREIRPVVFTDLRGYSRLRDEHVPVFVEHVLTRFAAALRDHGVLWANTWGDAIVAVFPDTAAAAGAVLELHDIVAATDLRGLGLPSDLALRVGAHVGSLNVLRDPVVGADAYWGRELTRAARIEPRTPPGEVYVTEAFAAHLALDVSARHSTEYVGRVTTAKDFETIPLYRLRPR